MPDVFRLYLKVNFSCQHINFLLSQKELRLPVEIVTGNYSSKSPHDGKIDRFEKVLSVGQTLQIQLQ
jgi:hypothetical protein